MALPTLELTAGRGSIGKETANYLRGFYRFRVEVLSPRGERPASTPLPASPHQVRPLLGQLDTHPEAALQMWKAACPSCRTKLALRITGYGALSPAVSALERALKLPPARPRA
jgi:hypothetical protein